MKFFPSTGQKILLICMAWHLISVDAGAQGEDFFMHQRERMVVEQIIHRGIKDARVLGAMRKVERHEFIPFSFRLTAYGDHPVAIGHGQTISQPYIVAYMTEALALQGNEKVLEIGTGSGYQAAILAEILTEGEVYTIEIVKALAQGAQERLAEMGYKNIFVKHGDGYLGWPEHAPFDAIIVTAAPEEIPEELIEQMKVGGRMILPVGSIYQELYLVTKTEAGVVKKSLLPVRFVPMVEGKGE